MEEPFRVPPVGSLRAQSRWRAAGAAAVGDGRGGVAIA